MGLEPLIHAWSSLSMHNLETHGWLRRTSGGYGVALHANDELCSVGGERGLREISLS